MIYVGDEIKWVPKEQLTDADIPCLVGLRGSGFGSGLQARRKIAREDLTPLVGVWTGGHTKTVLIEELTREQVDEDLLEDLQHFTTVGTTGRFVSPRRSG